MVTTFRHWLLSGMCAIGCNCAVAGCNPNVPTPTLYVGSDTHCIYHDIQTAINAVSPTATCAPIVYVTNEHAWTAQALTIANRSLTLAGTNDNCSGTGGTTGIDPIVNAVATLTPPPRKVKISGSGQTSQSVLTITGNSTVTIQDIDIADGFVNRTISKGGGIFFNAIGSLTLNAVTLESNTADYGGGLDIEAPAGNSAVVTLTGNTFISSNHSTNMGGGVFFGGSGSLTLDGATVSSNTSGDNGGGIAVSPSNGGSATLTLQGTSTIQHNSSSESGGGIFVKGDTHLIVMQASALIDNRATQYGGGIDVTGPARADIGAPSYLQDDGITQAVISKNISSYGGGIAVQTSGTNENATVQLFSTDAHHPVGVSGNRALTEGGALYVVSSTSPVVSTSVATVCATNFLMNGNFAPEGAAVYVDGASSGLYGGEVVMTSNASQVSGQFMCGAQTPAAFGSVACAAGVSCNEISANQALTGNNVATDGAAIFVAGTFNAQHLRMRNNTVGHVMHSAIMPSFGYAALYASLVADNHFSDDEFVTDNGELDLFGDTLANNVIGGSHVLELGAHSNLTMVDTLISEGHALTVDAATGATFNVRNNLSNDSTTSVAAFMVDPLFVDAANGNFHLKASSQNGQVTISPAIDASPGNYQDVYQTDLDGNPECQDVPSVGQVAFTCDIGAYEAQPIADRVFADAFGDATSLVY